MHDLDCFCLTGSPLCATLLEEIFRRMNMFIQPRLIENKQNKFAEENMTMQYDIQNRVSFAWKEIFPNLPAKLLHKSTVKCLN